jgi:hypothetical protein
VVIEVTAVDAEPLASAVRLAADLAAVLGRYRGLECDLVAVLLDLVEGDEATASSLPRSPEHGTTR